MIASNTITPKDPLDVDLYVIDFQLLFPDPAYITGFTCDTTPNDLIIVSSRQVGKQVQILVGGGQAGVIYSLAATATGNDSRTIRRSIPVPVKTR